MPKKGLTAVKVTFMTMTLVTLVTAVKFDYGTVIYNIYPFAAHWEIPIQKVEELLKLIAIY